VISCRITSHAPKPSSATCSDRRTPFAIELTIPDRMPAAHCGRDAASRSRCHACSQAGGIPIAINESALRTAASASPITVINAAPPRWMARRVSSSFNSARENSATPPATPIQPSSGWIRKATAKKIGVHGASRSGHIA
jgi:hypothetical protein